MRERIAPGQFAPESPPPKPCGPGSYRADRQPGWPVVRGAAERLPRALLGAVLAAQAVHCFVLLLLPDPVAVSNVLQAFVPELSAGVCLYKARSAETKHQRRIWMQLSFAFLIWMLAQFFYLFTLVSKALPSFVSIRFLSSMSDVLWLLFAFPLLLVASSTPRSSRRDLVGWLDTAQACMFFSVLFALTFSRPDIISLPLAYDLQSLALVLAFALRYSITEQGPERVFYRHLAIYACVYALCTAAGYAGWNHGLPPGSLIDLCWTAPFTAFSAMVLSKDLFATRALRAQDRGFAFPTHLHGISALGLAVMSVVASDVLAHHRPALGSLTLLAAFLLFAARTSTREWQLHSMHSRFEYSALHDPLTGLKNRAMLQQELRKRLESATAVSKERTGLLFIDLDRFKTINDGLGHAFGDLLLVQVARLLRVAARPQDIVARYGGDEFVVLLDQVDAEEAEALAQRFIETLRQPLSLEGRLFHVTASIGVVLGAQDSTADGMLQDADCAMYKAKGLGKDRAQTFAPNMLAAVKGTLDLETDLRKALAEHAIQVQYQPIYAVPRAVTGSGPGTSPGNAVRNTLQGFEALARWRHPERGAVSPGEFIPVAEDTGLILELGRQVLRQACQQCHAWNQRFGVRLTVSVNVSARQFANPGLLHEITTIVRETQLDPRLLKLEITESVLLSGYQAVEKVLVGARALGIQISLDDFGTGYSSLSYLLRFPFDVVKIDRSFVHHLDRDRRRAEMVRMVIQLAATLKKKVVAEGVESPEELARLREFGCDMVQGYLLSKPLAPEAVETLLLAEGLTETPRESPSESQTRVPGWLSISPQKGSRCWKIETPSSLAVPPAHVRRVGQARS